MTSQPATDIILLMITKTSQKNDANADIDFEIGATTLEWALLLASVALPAFVLIRLALLLLTDHYRMMTIINSLPFP